MEKVILEGADFTSREIAHTILKESLLLPDYYGRNLDALWDSLTSDYVSKMIIIHNPQAIQANLGRYGRAMLGLFKEIGQKHPSTRIVYAYSFGPEYL